jgi:hypothetical protein
VTILTAAFLFAGAQTAAAEGLFRPANLTARAASTLRDTPPLGMRHLRITRNALVRVDPVYLRSRLAPANTTHLVTPGQRNAAASRLSPDLILTLFPDVTLRLRRDFVVSYGPELFAWEGDSIDERYNCGASLASEHGIVGGQIDCGDRFYNIRHVDGSLYRVWEAVRVTYPTDEVDETTRPARGKDSRLRAPAHEGNFCCEGLAGFRLSRAG